MDPYLAFTLSAGIASMGSNAGNEFRGTLSWPGRSAILGLVAAARGFDRLDAEGHEKVSKHNVAIGIHDIGASFTDFHTIQSVPRAAVKRPATRGDALALARAKGSLETTLSRRDYRTDVLYSVALWGGDIEAALVALQTPASVLYLGRKSCPLNAPLAPRIVEAADPGAALRSAVLPYWKNEPLQSIATDTHPALQGRKITRNDDPTCRNRWEFRNRTVTVLDVAQET